MYRSEKSHEPTIWNGLFFAGSMRLGSLNLQGQSVRCRAVGSRRAGGTQGVHL